ncbi:hypothetical protein OFEAOIEE_LOCUS3796 [Methylorubrum extorquens]
MVKPSLADPARNGCNTHATAPETRDARGSRVTGIAGVMLERIENKSTPEAGASPFSTAYAAVRGAKGQALSRVQGGALEKTRT